MPRIYSNYSEAEYAIVREASESAGLSMSTYQRHCTLLSSNNKDVSTVDLPSLINTMKENLAQLTTPGSLFIVSALLPAEWPSLTKQVKNTLAHALKQIVVSHPDQYKINAILPGKINQYIVL